MNSRDANSNGIRTCAWAGLVAALTMATPIHADDTEIYTAVLEAAQAAPQLSPNLVILLDTSSSMRGSPGFFADPREVHGPYDPAKTYPGRCNPAHVYFDRTPEPQEDPANDAFYESLKDSNGDPDLDNRGYEQEPISVSCSTSSYFPLAAYTCNKFDLQGQGYARAKMQAYRPLVVENDGKNVYYENSNDYDGEWHFLSIRDRDRYSIWRDPATLVKQPDGSGEEMPLWRECLDDYGNHGASSSSGEVYPVEDGDAVVSSNLYDQSGTDGSDGLVSGFTSNPAHPDVLASANSDWDDTLMYTGNFMNWYLSAQTRLEIMRGVIRSSLKELADQGKNVRVALMRFDARLKKDSNNNGDNDSSDEEINPAHGGMVIQEAVGLLDDYSGKTGYELIVEALEPIEAYSGWGSPLGEATLEALLYYGGRKVGFGALSTINHEVAAPAGYPVHYGGNADFSNFPSVAGSRNSGNPNEYDSPITHSCQENHLMLLSDGQPSNDYNIKETTPDPGYDDNYWQFLEFGIDYEGENRCVQDPGPDGEYFTADDSTSSSYCLTALAHYMQNRDILDSRVGEQHVAFHTVGFGKQLELSDRDYLEATAEIGGGLFRIADSWESMKSAFQVITTNVTREDTTFTAPAVTVNNMNRTEEENEVYFGVFKTGLTQHWPGNLKKYQYGIHDNDLKLLDANGDPAIGPDGYFSDGALSFWSSEIDGNDVEKGGAARRLAPPASRKLYTVLPGASLPASIVPEPVEDGNIAITAAMLGAGSAAARSAAIEWLLGDDGSGNQVFRIGDPLHSQPVIVTYERSSTVRDQVIFYTTNSGMLHAVDAETGNELFAFIPPETLANAYALSLDGPGKLYGLDSSVQVLLDEGTIIAPGINVGTDDNGVDDTDDHLYLYFGMRRGGRNIFAMDVTDRSDPKLLWKILGGDLDANGVRDDATEPYYDMGYTFSEPRIGQLRLDNQRRYILAVGGGYDLKQDDPQQDGEVTTTDSYVADDYGNAIYIIDAMTGERLWWAGNSFFADQLVPEMKNSIPSAVNLLDMNHNGWSDRLYVGDTGGRLYRVDIEDISPNSFVTASGGMIANFGGEGFSGDDAVTNNRKFFYPPDVVVAQDDPDYVALLIGSGNRAHPSYPVESDPAVRDVFLMLRDPYTLSTPSSYNYGLELDDLYDATANTLSLPDNPTAAEITAYNAALTDYASKKGWFIDLPNDGEKVLAEAVTYGYRTYFTTFEPLDIDFATCKSRVGNARIYAVDSLKALPVNPYFDFLVDGEADDPAGRSTIMEHAGIPPAPTINFFAANGGDSSIHAGLDSPESPPGEDIRRTYWYIVD